MYWVVADVPKPTIPVLLSIIKEMLAITSIGKSTVDVKNPTVKH
jgi:hypothetical protein